MAAVLYKLSPQWSAYANYAEGLSQGKTAPATAANRGQMLAPYVAKQTEAGVKWDGGRLGGSLGAIRVTFGLHGLLMRHLQHFLPVLRRRFLQTGQLSQVDQQTLQHNHGHATSQQDIGDAMLAPLGAKNQAVFVGAEGDVELFA